MLFTNTPTDLIIPDIAQEIYYTTEITLKSTEQWNIGQSLVSQLLACVLPCVFYRQELLKH